MKKDSRNLRGPKDSLPKLLADKASRSKGIQLQEYLQVCDYALALRNGRLAGVQDLDAKMKAIVKECPNLPSRMQLALVEHRGNKDMESADLTAYIARNKAWASCDDALAPFKFDEPSLHAVECSFSDKLAVMTHALIEMTLNPLLYDGQDQCAPAAQFAKACMISLEADDIFEMAEESTQPHADYSCAIGAVVGLTFSVIGNEHDDDVKSVYDHKGKTGDKPQHFVACAVFTTPYWKAQFELWRHCHQLVADNAADFSIAKSRLQDGSALAVDAGTAGHSVELMAFSSTYSKLADKLPAGCAPLVEFGSLLMKRLCAHSEKVEARLRELGPEDRKAYQQLLMAYDGAFPGSADVQQKLKNLKELDLSHAAINMQKQLTDDLAGWVDVAGDSTPEQLTDKIASLIKSLQDANGIQILPSVKESLKVVVGKLLMLTAFWVTGRQENQCLKVWDCLMTFVDSDAACRVTVQKVHAFAEAASKALNIFSCLKGKPAEDVDPQTANSFFALNAKWASVVPQLLPAGPLASADQLKSFPDEFSQAHSELSNMRATLAAAHMTRSSQHLQTLHDKLSPIAGGGGVAGQTWCDGIAKASHIDVVIVAALKVTKHFDFPAFQASIEELDAAQKEDEQVHQSHDVMELPAIHGECKVVSARAWLTCAELSVIDAFSLEPVDARPKVSTAVKLLRAAGQQEKVAMFPAVYKQACQLLKSK